MTARFSLLAKILLIAFLNLSLVAGITAFYLHAHFGFDLTAYRVRQSHDRIVAIAREVALDIGGKPRDAANRILLGLEQRYAAQIYPCENSGRQLMGESVELPGKVRSRINAPPPQGALGTGQLEPPPGAHPPDDRGPEGVPEPGLPGATLFVEKAATGYWIGVRVPVPNPDTGDTIPGLLFIVTPSLKNPALFGDIDEYSWVAPAALALLVTLLCWVPFLRGVTRSIGRIEHATDRIAEGHFKVHLDDARSDELGRVGESVLRMATRLDQLVAGQKRFLGDVAHELCSPIARMQLAVSLLEQRVPEATLHDLRDEVDQMSALVSQLLNFSKSSLKCNLVLKPVNVREAAQTALDRENTPEMTRGTAQVELNIDSRLSALADRESLVRALGNLIRNAIRHAGECGPISVLAAADNGSVVVRVCDQGPGLPEEELDKVLAPFYRPELSRTREEGGAGLGLAIVKSCVESCEGSVRLRNRKPHGLEAEIRLARA